jgi:hypothetical protein
MLCRLWAHINSMLKNFQVISKIISVVEGLPGMRQVRVRFSLINILNLFHSKGSLWPQIDFIVWERHYLGSVGGVGSLIWLGGHIIQG